MFAPERDKAIAKEVKKLLEASFIREVYYSEWLANIVMVKKGQWKMANVRRLHGPQQGMPKRQLPPPSNKHSGRFDRKTRAPMLHGCLFRI